LDTPVKRYSSGMYVRLAFAVAAHLEQEILVVDEVLAVGDTHFQKKCLRKMQDVATHDGRTVLFVSHNLPAVQSLCDRAILLDNGRVAMQDAPAECIHTFTSTADTETTETVAYFERPRGISPWIRSAHLVAKSGATRQITMGDPLTIEVAF